MNRLAFILLFLVSGNYADKLDDVSHHLPGMVPADSTITASPAGTAERIIPLNSDPSSYEDKSTLDEKNPVGSSGYIPSYNKTSTDEPKKITDREAALSSGNEIPFKYESEKEVITFRNEQLIKNFGTKGNNQFSISFIPDNFKYDNPAHSFKKTYREGDKADFAAMLKIDGHSYFVKEFFDFGIGLGLSVGYNGGLAHFVSSEGGKTQSESRFRLWTVPADLSFLVDLNLSRFYNVGGKAGPSVMAIWQHRSDLPQGNSDKDIQQYSFGYFVEGNFKISLMDIFPQTTYEVFSQYDVTKMYFSIFARHQSYENFREKISISGTSIGVGFSYNYL
ncbi:MAG: hypothetical protein U0T83_02330 [Bacteriovoracaceae bacterium]